MVALADQCDHRELAMIGHGWTIADTLSLGDVHRARAAITAFTRLAEKSRHPYFVWWLAAIRTMQAILEGRLAEAETLAQECFARGRRAVEIDATHVFAGHFYVLCMEGLRYDELEPLMHGVVTQFAEIPSGRVGLALLHTDRGRMAEAAAELAHVAPDRFAILPRNPEWLTTMAALAQTSVAHPDAPHAATLYELLSPYRHRVVVAGMGVLVAGSVAHFLGTLATRLGRFDEAEACLTEALAVHERLGALPLRAYTQHAYAVLALTRLAPGDETLAARLIAEARAYAESHGMRRLARKLEALLSAPAVHVDAAPHATPPGPARTAVLRKEGDDWRLGWEQAGFRLRDRVGLHYLAALIANPAREILAVDLVRTTGGRRGGGATTTNGGTELAADLGRGRVLASADATLDLQAELAYRARLQELRSVLEDARHQNDLGRIAAAEGETDALTHEIARSLGFQSRGRDSRSPIERARVSATRAIRVAIRLIQENDRALGRHLTVTIKTGTFCSYVPDPELAVAWQL
jgi:tetratricopeptide (TPR) repeat protein